MFKLIRLSFFIVFVISLLITTETFAFFKTPQWLDSHNHEKTFWSQMSKDFAIDCDEQNPSIQKHIRWYLQHQKHLNHVLKCSEPFIHYVYEQTQRKNLPAELALIPLLESQYNPAIGTKSGAAGLWQIMPGTAAKFGLKINHCYDGRRDVTASTKAALNYLSYLYHYFHEDWLLALAAYDAGEGKVQSISHRKHVNFWQLPLSRETKEYVPRLLAIASIIKQSKTYNIRLPIVAEKQLQEVIWNEAKTINLMQAARNLGIDHNTLRHYNPGFRQNVASIPDSITLLIPSQKGVKQTYDSEVVKPSANLPSQPVINVAQDSTSQTFPKKSSGTYKVKKGDTLRSIAKKLQVDTQQFKKINHLKTGKLKIGQTLVAPAKKRPRTTKSCRNYKIHPGDSLSSISRKCHVPIKKLKTINHLKNERQLQIGHIMLIPEMK